MSTIIRNGINQLLFVFGNNSRDRKGAEIPRARTIKTGTMCMWRWGWGAPTQSSGDRENTAEVMLTRKGREHPVKDWHLSRGGVSNGSSDKVHRGFRNPRDCRKTKSTGRLSGLDVETVQLEGLAAKQLVKRPTPKAGRRGTWDEGGRSSSSAPQGEPRMRRDPHSHPTPLPRRPPPRLPPWSASLGPTGNPTSHKTQPALPRFREKVASVRHSAHAQKPFRCLASYRDV